MARLFLPDGNWYMHRVYHSLRSNRPIEEALPYQVVRLICKDALAVRADYLLFAVDGPEVFRHKVWDGYKGNRDPKEQQKKQKPKNGRSVDIQEVDPGDTIYRCLPAMFTLLAQIGISFYQPRKYEADDVLNSIARAYASPELTVIGGTQDKDGYQWLGPYAHMYNSLAKDKAGKSAPRYIKVKDAQKSKGVKISQMVDYQTLIGDSIDGITGLPGVGPKTAQKILATYGSIRGWYEKGSPDDRRKLVAQQELLRRNRKLVTLSEKALPPGDPEQWKLERKTIHTELPASYYDYLNFVYPRSRGLFG